MESQTQDFKKQQLNSLNIAMAQNKRDALSSISS